MTAHLLGWLTLASEAGLGAWVTRYLFSVKCDPRSWVQPIPTPKYAELVPIDTEGPDGFSDYVGLI